MPGLHKKPKGYVSDAQRKAVHASKKDGGKGNPNKPKMKVKAKAKPAPTPVVEEEVAVEPEPEVINEAPTSDDPADWEAFLADEGLAAIEDDLALDLGLEPGEVVIDFPAKRAMFQLNVLVERRGGQIQRLGQGGLPGLLDLPRLADNLYTTARVLRVFTFERRSIAAEDVLTKIMQ